MLLIRCPRLCHSKFALRDMIGGSAIGDLRAEVFLLLQFTDWTGLTLLQLCQN
jgi:hypothetical protein